jgi:hypothetical protein
MAPAAKGGKNMVKFRWSVGYDHPPNCRKMGPVREQLLRSNASMSPNSLMLMGSVNPVLELRRTATPRVFILIMESGSSPAKNRKEGGLRWSVGTDHPEK